MGRRLTNIIGNKYNRLTVIAFSHMGKNGKSFWKCRCDCGNETVLQRDTFVYVGRPKQAKSCGCLKQERDKLLGNSMKSFYKAFLKKCKE